MNDLAQFLLDRIAEDEALARASITDYCDSEWRVDDGLGVVDRYDSVLVYREGDEPFIRHIARWDPAWVLGECDAKRQIIDEWRRSTEPKPPGPEGWRKRLNAGNASGLHQAMRILASIYVDHPDYPQEWRP